MEGREVQLFRGVVYPVTTCYDNIEDEITVTSSAISVVYYYHPFT
jgi:hypothetical protein